MAGWEMTSSLSRAANQAFRPVRSDKVQITDFQLYTKLSDTPEAWLLPSITLQWAERDH